MFSQLAALVALMFQTLIVPALPVLSVAEAVISADIQGVDAPSLFLIDTQNKRILGAKNPDAERPIASITKLMTALVVLDRVKDSPSANGLSFMDDVIVDQKDQRRGDIARIIPGETLALHEVWDLMLVASSNDAAALLARTVAGDEKKFVEAMNAKARQIGLKRTRFEDPTGLHPGNVSTAREVAILTRLALSFSEIRDTVSKAQTVVYPKGKVRRSAPSTNQLLRWFNLPGVRIFGGKTGHIEESGYNLVFAAGDEGRDLVGVILGSESNNARFEEMATLLKWGFSATPRSQFQGD